MGSLFLTLTRMFMTVLAAGQAHVLLGTLQGQSGRVEAVSPTLNLDLGAGVTMELVLVPAGEFLMGSSAEEAYRDDDEGPQHRVRISKPFYMCKHEVTVGQFRRFVESTDYRTDAEKQGWSYGYGKDGKWQKVEGLNWRHPGYKQADDHPVVCVSWNDATEYCSWLSSRGDGEYRLPTEAQWEYACRAGTKTVYQWGNDQGTGEGWCNGGDQTVKQKHPDLIVFDWSDGYAETSPADSLRANRWGLCGMHGNAWEWCSDGYDSQYYANSPHVDPTGPAGGMLRIIRGGSWISEPRLLRSANRGMGRPAESLCCNGFRVVSGVIAAPRQ